jgi:hypothetical protein
MYSKHRKVRIPPRLRNKVANVHQKLAEEGVEIELDDRTREPRTNYLWHTPSVRDMWLVYSISKEAIAQWPKIREILINAGLTGDEITTLGLSTLKPKAKKKKRKTGA